MWWTLGISVIAAVGVIVLWYGLWLRWNRRRAQKLLVNIESAFSSNGYVSGIRWVSGSAFQVRLRLGNCAFTHSSVVVHMLPREMPLNWIASWFKKRRETLTFEANLLCPPAFNLEVQNQRWHGGTRRRLPRKDSTVRFDHIGPFILTSRSDWQREITSMVHALSASRDCDLISVSFRRNAPHFSATVALDAVANEHCSPVRIFDALRELASGASAAKF